MANIRKVMSKILSVASAVLLSFMTVLVLWQVFTRYVLNNPAAFTEELVKYSLMWTAFIGAALAFFTRDSSLFRCKGCNKQLYTVVGNIFC